MLFSLVIFGSVIFIVLSQALLELYIGASEGTTKSIGLLA
jgi:hypothetical protein